MHYVIELVYGRSAYGRSNYTGSLDGAKQEAALKASRASAETRAGVAWYVLHQDRPVAQGRADCVTTNT